MNKKKIMAGLLVICLAFVNALRLPSARLTALRHSAGLFSDEPSGVLFNPAMIIHSPSYTAQFSHRFLFLNNNADILAGVIKKKKYAYGGMTAVIHHLFYNKEYDPYYEQGFIVNKKGNKDFNFLLTAGGSYRITRSFWVGAGLDINIDFLYKEKIFDSVLKAACYYRLPFQPFGVDTLTAGADLHKRFLGNRFSKNISWEDGVSGSIGMRYSRKKWRLDGALTLNFDYLEQDDSYKALPDRYSRQGMSLGIGLEGLRGWYASPAVSVKIPFNGMAPELNAGLTAGIDFRGFFYALGWAFNKSFDNKWSLENFNHVFTFTFRRSTGSFVFIPFRPLQLPEDGFLFGALRENYPAPERVPIKNVDKMIGVKIKQVDFSGKKELLPMAGRLELSLASFIKESRTLSESPAPELIISPLLTTVGRIMQLKVTVKNSSGRLLKTFKFEGDFFPDNKNPYGIDILHFAELEDGPRFTGQADDTHSKNIATVLTLYEKWREAFNYYLEKHFYKKVTITANTIDALIRINGRAAAYYAGLPLEFFLKPGNYTFSASAPGHKTVTFSKNIDSSQAVSLAHTDKTFLVDVKVALFGRRDKLKINTGTKKLTFQDRVKLTNISSSLKSLKLEGLGSPLAIPLDIEKRMIYNVNILNNYRTRFNKGEDIWRLVGSDIKGEYSRAGLQIKGRSRESGAPGGVVSRPFILAENAVLTFTLEKAKRGYFSFILFDEKENKFSIKFDGRNLAVTSDFGRKTTANKKLVRAYRVYNKAMDISIKREQGQITVFKGDVEIYSGAFNCRGPLQILFAGGAQKDGVSVEYKVKDFNYEIL
ncbi:MAG TPA: hypothetical protein VKS21_11730 [Spirochaetota bacterium]|nr:hypothetical protein [Spirochaetota bacterium]